MRYTYVYTRQWILSYGSRYVGGNELANLKILYADDSSKTNLKFRYDRALSCRVVGYLRKVWMCGTTTSPLVFV